jgi:exopolyphosphatase/guanosine-5'-triphosphate,3'-diphosphate pyrophosphatase
MLVLGCRGGCRRWRRCSPTRLSRAQVLALRLAVLFHHARRSIGAPRVELRVGKSVRLAVAPRWIAAHPLTTHLLEKEQAEWEALGYPFKLSRRDGRKRAVRLRGNRGRARP